MNVNTISVTLEVVDGPSYDVDADGWEHYAYKVRLRYQGRSLTVPWKQGLGLTDEPTVTRILEALAEDAATIKNAPDFEDWANELGYEVDSRKAEDIYRAVRKQARGLERLLGDDFQSVIFPEPVTSPDGKTRGRIVSEGMGAFLNPPGNAEHMYSVEFDLERSPENRSRMSLQLAADADWLDDLTRAQARELLGRTAAPALDSPEVRDWIAQVLGYFRNCYRGRGVDGPEAWHAGHMDILDPWQENAEGGPRPVAEHAGVHFVRKFYPEFEPTREDFAGAYWGTKPEPVEA